MDTSIWHQDKSYNSVQGNTQTQPIKKPRTGLHQDIDLSIEKTHNTQHHGPSPILNFLV